MLYNPNYMKCSNRHIHRHRSRSAVPGDGGAGNGAQRCEVLAQEHMQHVRTTCYLSVNGLCGECIRVAKNVSFRLGNVWMYHLLAL